MYVAERSDIQANWVVPQELQLLSLKGQELLLCSIENAFERSNVDDVSMATPGRITRNLSYAR